MEAAILERQAPAQATKVNYVDDLPTEVELLEDSNGREFLRIGLAEEVLDLQRQLGRVKIELNHLLSDSDRKFLEDWKNDCLNRLNKIFHYADRCGIEINTGYFDN